jgi:pyrroloquinoline quinone biosynthesis protein B
MTEARRIQPEARTSLRGAAALEPVADQPYVIVLGIAQDGGVPQAGMKEDALWNDPARRRMVVCLGIVDPASRRRWMVDATPDFREQLRALDRVAPPEGASALDGILLTHAHIGHYTGLMFLGFESMGTRGLPVYAMPRMRAFLESNGPWSQLVRYHNIELVSLADRAPSKLDDGITVTPFLVPHRQEFSEAVGFRIKGPHRKVLYIPDIDSWEEWDEAGTRIEDEIARVDVAYLDATFSADGEIPGRDMSGFPHPFIAHSMERFAPLPASERAKVRFIHLNHTNPALWPGTDVRRRIEAAGFRVAEEMERIGL